MHEEFMRVALELAQKGKGRVNPNPLVGAIIVKDGRIIGKGYHEKYGENHAEINAFESAIEDTSGATMYVTLEPCSHYGKTPPCADKIIEKNISKVVIGTLDPNPLVSGKGVNKLRDAGIEVITGILEEECLKINEIFMKYIKENKPFVLLKSAMSLDGKIATSIGESKWITGEEARAQVHKLRNEYSAIMVGVDTVIKDNPQLNCRLKDGRNPIKIIVDSKLRISMESNIVKNARKEPVILATTTEANEEKINALKDKEVRVLVVDSENGKVNLKKLVGKLGELKIDGILLEGGATLAFSAIESGIVDKVNVYIAPKLIGGQGAKTPLGGNGIERLKDAFEIRNMDVRFVGEDILIEGYLKGGHRDVHGDS